jgi:hypothetical protein
VPLSEDVGTPTVLLVPAGTSISRLKPLEVFRHLTIRCRYRSFGPGKVTRLRLNEPGFVTGFDRLHAVWLGETDEESLKDLLVPYPADQMRMWEISPRVNSPKNDDPSLWEPIHSEPAWTPTDPFELVREDTLSLSRASQEVRLYTDSSEVLKEAAIRPGQGQSAVELIDGAQMPTTAIGHNGKALRQEPAQKFPCPSSAQATRLQKEIQKAVPKYEKTPKENISPQPHHPPTPPEPRHDRTQEPGMSMGF